MGISLNMSNIEALKLSIFTNIRKYEDFLYDWQESDLINQLDDIEKQGMNLMMLSIGLLATHSVFACVEMNMPDQLCWNDRVLVHVLGGATLIVAPWLYMAHKVNKLATSITTTQNLYNQTFKQSASQQN